MGGILELDGLARRFGPVVALDGLSFSVPAGQVAGFLGPNGAGKTTTMRAVFGLTDLDDGTVRWNGAPVRQRDRRRFGYMPEERGLYPGMLVREHLTYLGRLHGMSAPGAAAAARAWLERLGVAGRMPAAGRIRPAGDGPGAGDGRDGHPLRLTVCRASVARDRLRSWGRSRRAHGTARRTRCPRGRRA